MQRLTKDRAHVRVNRSGVLRDHIKNLVRPGFQIRVGMDAGTIRKALTGYQITVELQKNGLGSPQRVRRTDGKMVPINLVTFQ
jgi:hypothetical protein